MKKIAFMTGAVLLAAGLLPAAADAAVTVAPFVFTDGVPAGSTTDAFDVSQGTVVTGTSGYNGATRPENALGGTSSTSEPQSLIFADGTQQLQTLSFKTDAAVTISGFNLYLAQDGVGNGNVRGFDTVALFGSLDGVSYANLGGLGLTNPYQAGYSTTSILVTSTFAPAAYQYFRFEGTPFDQGGFSETFSGGRLVELDAISAVSGVPEPASWTLMIVGFGLVGAGMRYRLRQATLLYAC